MRRAILCIVVLTAVCALSAAAAQSAGPVIEGVNVYQGRDSHCDWRGVDWHEEVNLFISDADGLSDIASVIVVDTRGEAHLLVPGDLGNPWSWWFESYGSLWVGWRNEDLSAPPPAGSYAVTVADGEGNVDSLTTAPVPDVPTVGPELLAPALDAVVHETVPTFSWGNYPPGAEAALAVRDDEGTVWDYWPGDATSVVYNADGRATAPELTPGRTYTWSVAWDIPLDVGISDPRVYTYFRQRSYGRFMVYSPTPRIEQVQIWRMRDIHPDWGGIDYHDQARVRVTDADGVGDIVSVSVTDPTGRTRLALPKPGDPWEWERVDEHTLWAGLNDWLDDGRSTAPPVGAYTVTVLDQAGNSDSLVTAVAPEVPGVSPALTLPPFNATVMETVPTFTWSDCLPGFSNGIHVSDSLGHGVWYQDVGPATSVTYNCDGTAAVPELESGERYGWKVESTRTDDPGMTDPRVFLYTVLRGYSAFNVGWHGATPIGSSVPVALENLVITFDTVTAEGVTWLGSMATPTAVSFDYAPVGSSYSLETTASYSGGITVTLQYSEAARRVLSGESPLLLQYDPETQGWQDITTGADLASNTVFGRTSTLGIFSLGLQPTPVPIQGTMMLSRCCPGPGSLYFISSDSVHLQPAAPTVGANGDLTRDAQKVAYVVGGQIHVCSADGSGDVTLPVQNVTSCGVRWSPDGTRLAFTMPAPDTPAVPAGFCQSGALFVIDADGTNLEQITHQAIREQPFGWSPDGRCVVWQNRSCPPDGPDALAPCSIWLSPVDGGEATEIIGPGRPIDNGNSVEWSPDGQRIAVVWSGLTDTGESACTIGTVAPDGSDPQEILQYSVPEGAAAAWWVWADGIAWSPDGTQLAFTTAMHVLPEPGERSDREVYTINADGTGLARVTYDTAEDRVRWGGPNTPAGTGSSTTICDATITFETVAEPGVTTAIVTETPPGPEPSGFQFLGEYYELRTTAQISGPVTVQIHYEDWEVPAGQEEWLSLLHWEDGNWVDVTVRPIDTVNNIITGQVTSLSPFAVVLQLDTTAPVLTVPSDVSLTTTDPDGAFVDIGTATAADDRDPNPVITNDAPAVFPIGTTAVTWTATDAAGNAATATQTVTVTLQRYANFAWVAPIANADRRLFKRGSTIPVKFTITDMGGSPATSAMATLTIYYLHDGAPEGEPLEASTANGDDGDLFRHTGDGQYLFNLSTKPPEWYPYYTFLAEVTLDDGQVFSQPFALK